MNTRLENCHPNASPELDSAITYALSTTEHAAEVLQCARGAATMHNDREHAAQALRDAIGLLTRAAREVNNAMDRVY